jgi:hypothetical protein
MSKGRWCRMTVRLFPTTNSKIQTSVRNIGSSCLTFRQLQPVSAIRSTFRFPRMNHSRTLIVETSPVDSPLSMLSSHSFQPCPQHLLPSRSRTPRPRRTSLTFLRSKRLISSREVLTRCPPCADARLRRNRRAAIRQLGRRGGIHRAEEMRS